MVQAIDTNELVEQQSKDTSTSPTVSIKEEELPQSVPSTVPNTNILVESTAQEQLVIPVDIEGNSAVVAEQFFDIPSSPGDTIEVSHQEGAVAVHPRTPVYDENNRRYPQSDFNSWKHKHYFGGYYNKRRQIEAFHATTQTLTPQEIRAMRKIERFHRESQTFITKNIKTQSTQESSTQMTKPGVYVDRSTDKTITPGRYITADEHHAMIVDNVTKLQCFFRVIKARRKVALLRKLRIEHHSSQSEKERNRIEKLEQHKQREIERRLHPRTLNDFKLLYSALDTWKEKEANDIKHSDMPKHQQLAALADLLDQEAALIQKIDRLKIAADEQNHDMFVQKMLDQMASPKKWSMKNGEYTNVETPHTIRAKELRDLYVALTLPLVSVDERLQILLHVKYTVKEFDCSVSRDIVQLIDREGDLLSRGREAKSLEGLRKRIGNLFLQFVRTPEFNPESNFYQRHGDPSKVWLREQTVYFCKMCTKYLPSSQFYLSSSLDNLGKCRRCVSKANEAFLRKDDCDYSLLLKAIRYEESKKLGKEETNDVLDQMAEADVRYLVDVVWNGQSAISGNRKLEDLLLTRWKATEQFSPWNCILLSKKESSMHAENVLTDAVYSYDFLRKVEQKTHAAKAHFNTKFHQ